VPRPPISLLTQARGLLGDACTATDAGERFRLAHLAALRIAAAALDDQSSAARRRLVSVWTRLEKSQYADRAAYFAAGASVRAAVEAGVASAASPALADQQLRAAADFLLEVEATLGLLAA
jgi:hypothetical protein